MLSEILKNEKEEEKEGEERGKEGKDDVPLFPCSFLENVRDRQ